MNDIIATVLRASVHRFIGRLGRDPEIRFFESGNCVANATIAINRPDAKKDDGQEPDWLKVEIWGEQAQRFADACKKGHLVDLVGRVKTDRWTDRSTGEAKMQLCIKAESLGLDHPTETMIAECLHDFEWNALMYPDDAWEHHGGKPDLSND